ncbi:MAG: type II secretion system protein [Sulfurospirillaceae bacterium]|nr:type II secretion system protein [Sulfurospirillaceae bacterium]
MLRIKRGFTLFELLIVIVIITSSYLLVIPFLSQNKVQPFEFKKLKNYLVAMNPSGKVTLICIKECQECYIFMGNEKIKTDAIKGNVVSYSFVNGHFEELEFFAPKYFEPHEKICFKYQVDSSNNLGDELLANYQDAFYYFSPYFNETMMYKELSEAQNHYKELLGKLKD